MSISEESSQLIFISSQNRSQGTIQSFTVDLIDGLISCPPKCLMKMVVLDVCINKSWYTINSSNNEFYITVNNIETTLITITPGNYNVYSLLQYLQATLTGWTITYSTIKNTYNFIPPNSTYGLLFFNRFCEALGFNIFDLPNGASFTSTRPVKIYKENAVYINSDLPKSSCSVDNLGSNINFNNSTIICKIPLCTSPDNNVIYEAKDIETYSYILSVLDLTELSFWLTDDTNQPIYPLYDWSITLKLVYLQQDEDKLLSTLTQIKDYVNYFFLRSENKNIPL